MESQGGKKESSSNNHVTQQDQNVRTDDNAASVKKTKNDENNPKKPLLMTTITTTLVSGGDQHITHKFGKALATPSTPRIELSRASSSSHHDEDSRESSPENVFEQVGTGTLQETIDLGFREEGALELRSSTEELYFMDSEQKKEEQEKLQKQQGKRSSPHIFRFDDHQSYLQQHQRKDSASSEVAALLCISGRTSRISSVGSQGSAVSHLSAVSGISRSPSPHRMLLETSFCGPKPLEKKSDGRNVNVDPTSVELLEQVLLSRKHDPTQVVLAEGIIVESSPKKKPTSLLNGNSKSKTETATQNRSCASNPNKETIESQRALTKSPGQMVIGKTASGTEYIRINLKPNHMYEDNGIASNERVVEAPNVVAPVYSRSHKKPSALSLSQNVAKEENHLTPTVSPKPSRRIALTKETQGSRSPSPANLPVSRKSSFNSLFRFGGGTEDSRSKSKERQTSQSQNVTPSKQKSVLAIFKTGKRASTGGTDLKSSKCSSPIDMQEQQQKNPKIPVPPPPQAGSRPPSRLRYYDEPVEGYIHIPLHTPPEEKETRKLLDSIQKLNEESTRPIAVTITKNELAAAAAALKPVGTRRNSKTKPELIQDTTPPAMKNLNNTERIDSNQSFPHKFGDHKERMERLEKIDSVSKDAQETLDSATNKVRSNNNKSDEFSADIKEATQNILKQKGAFTEAEIHRLPSVESTISTCEAQIIETIAMVNSLNPPPDETSVTKDKRHILFATRLGSGSQEQIFSTQFSISKTDSESSQLSEQVPDTSSDIFATDHLHRQSTILRRVDDKVTIGLRSVPKQPQLSTAASEGERTNLPVTVGSILVKEKGSTEEPSANLLLEEENRIKAANLANAAVVVSGIMENQRRSRLSENSDQFKNPHEISNSYLHTMKTSEKETISEEIVVSQGNTNEYFLKKSKPTLPEQSLPSTVPLYFDESFTSKTTISRGDNSPSHAQSKIENFSTFKPSIPDYDIKANAPQLPSFSSQVNESISKSYRQSLSSIDQQLVDSANKPRESSESERDSDFGTVDCSTTVVAANDMAKRHQLSCHISGIEDHESTGLVSQDSFDDELPYIPTTLPEERAQGVSLIPMKERAHMELKTCPLERPRSTTPLNPSHLEEYYCIATPQDPTFESTSGSSLLRGEKLRINLPRRGSQKDQNQSSKSPRRTSNASGKSWFEFAEEGLRAGGSNLERRDSSKQLITSQVGIEKNSKMKDEKEVITPTFPTRTSRAGITAGGSSQRKLSGHWIDFEKIPEKRKAPKRITTLPKDTHAKSNSHATAPRESKAVPDVRTAHVPKDDISFSKTLEDTTPHYNYVKPEECQCDCHEVEREIRAIPGESLTKSSTNSEVKAQNDFTAQSTNPLLPHGEDLLPLLAGDLHEGIDPSESSREYSSYTDDELDAAFPQTSSTRSRLEEFPRQYVPRKKKLPERI